METIAFYSVPVLGTSRYEGSGTTVVVTRYDVGSARKHEIPRPSTAELILNVGTVTGVLLALVIGASVSAVAAAAVGAWNHSSRGEAIDREHTKKVLAFHDQAHMRQIRGETIDYKKEQDQLDQDKYRALTENVIGDHVLAALASPWAIGLGILVFLGFAAILGHEFALDRLMKAQARRDRGTSGRDPKLYVVREDDWQSFRMRMV